MRKKIGGGLLIAVSVAAPVVVDKMDIQLTDREGIALLIVCAVVAIIGLALVLWPGRQSPPPSRKPSTTIRARGGGKIDLEDFDSSADTFADVEDIESLTARRGRHSPASRPARRDADGGGNGSNQ